MKRLVAALTLLLVAGSFTPAAASEVAVVAPEITIDSPTDGAGADAGGVTVRGHYTQVSDIQLVVDAQRTVPATMDAATGTWSAKVSLKDSNGTVGIAAYGKNLETLYNQWSPFVTVDVHNPRASRPVVTITSPAIGAALGGSRIMTTIAVSSTRPIRRVEARVNGGAWRAAQRTGSGYRVQFAAAKGFAGIEARAVDVTGQVGTSATTYVGVDGAVRPVQQRYNQDRAMWLWEQNSYPAVFDRTARDQLGRFMDDTTTYGSDPIRTLYVGVAAYEGRDMLKDSRGQVAAFVRWARGRGYHVQAVIAGGTVPPYLGALPQYQDRAVAEFTKVLDYNLAVPADAQFDGVNVDIEPYLLPQWKAAGTTLPAHWLDLLEKFMQLRDASGEQLLVGPAIPFWFDSSDCCTAITWHGRTAPLSDHVQDLTDYVSLMDYTDTATGIIARADHEVAYAATIGKPGSVVIGIETKDLSGTGDPESVTFYEEGRAYLESELDKVYAAEATAPGFAGIAMHHYGSLLVLPK
ncbi:Ig-like domain-containing protein [Kribbella sp. NPDC048928]|uniref:Ig-like domain-containing protein n=1 Tax=Kribbella sp. NPDC048928 TaxID=3364111 RepID=UPI00370F91F3